VSDAAEALQGPVCVLIAMISVPWCIMDDALESGATSDQGPPVSAQGVRGGLGTVYYWLSTVQLVSGDLDLRLSASSWYRVKWDDCSMVSSALAGGRTWRSSSLTLVAIPHLVYWT